MLCCAEAAATNAAGLALRGFTYQAMGQLAQRAPELFQQDTDIAAQMFSALSVEPPGVRAALQEALSTLSTAYKGCSGKQLALLSVPLLHRHIATADHLTVSASGMMKPELRCKRFNHVCTWLHLMWCR